MKPFQQTPSELSHTLSTHLERGLSQEEAANRLEIHGLNKLPESKQPSLLHVFLTQFQSPLIYILLIAAAIIFFLGDPLDACIISGVLFFNAIIGTIQEGRATNILESLKQYIKSEAVVVRNGKRTIVPDFKVTVGDVLILQEGEKVPADARLIEANNLLVNEAMLTGESSGVYKSTDVQTSNVPIIYQNNMVFRGTYILSGYAKAVVTATGVHTEIGKLGTTIEAIQTDTPLKQEVDRLSHWILLFILGICVFLFLFGLAIGKSFTELLVMLTALFICVIPEGLPVVLTLTLVTGAFRMAKKNVLVKRLQAVEGLGRADVIIIDKTGTLTRNELVVSELYANGQRFSVSGEGYHSTGSISYEQNKISSEQKNKLHQLATACALADHAQLEYIPQLKLFHIKGEPIEAALGIFAHKAGVGRAQVEKEYNLLHAIPFDPERRYQLAVYEKDGSVHTFVTGAPEVLSPTQEHAVELEALLADGYRVVAVAHAQLELQPTVVAQMKRTQLVELIFKNIKLLGLLGIQDTIRPEVATTVQQARQAGLHIVMATGDHAKTALFVAKRVGIFSDGDTVLDGEELEKLSDRDLSKHIASTTVFSRVSPDDKLRLVRAFQAHNNTVAMTGDGVNDAPSLVASDLGIAMGSIGTEVAKQASDMILLDDSFTSIIEAVKEGRHIFYTLKRTILYFFTTNFGEVLIVLFALLANFPLPISAAQILWLNLITDGFLDAALAMEPKEEGLLQNQQFKGKRLVDRSTLIKMLYMSIPMAVGSLIIFYHWYPIDIVKARTLVLVTMAMFQWFNAWNCRSETLSIFQIGLFSNKWLIIATTFVFGLQLLLLHNPFLQAVFDTVPLTRNEWFLVIATSSTLLVIEEVRKLLAQLLARHKGA